MMNEGHKGTATSLNEAALSELSQMGFTTAPPLPLPVESDVWRTHTSHHGLPHYAFEGPLGSHSNDYERLEHFGDAVLQLAVTELIWRLYKEVTVGAATSIRCSVVCNAYFAKLCAYYGFQNQLLGSPVSLRDKERTRAALFEAYVGALYYQYGAVTTNQWIQSVFEPVIHTTYNKFNISSSGSDCAPLPPLTGVTAMETKTPKSVLTEWAVLHGVIIPEAIFESNGSSHDLHHSCKLSLGGMVFEGKGKKRKDAEHEAAQNALNYLKTIPLAS